ncbi:MAG: arylsulfatase [Actinobacteria bacterium]|nr:arylsulfatase [Actinomycetota bacterium]
MGQKKNFKGTIGRTFEDSKFSWEPLNQPPAGTPNILIVLLDDVGYAQFGCYGSDIATPTFDALAANGLRYANYHTTALCSPTRACLMTGRNHHSNGMARVIEMTSGFPGYDAEIPHENGFMAEMLQEKGWATFALGKWHLTPPHERNIGGPRTRWPLSKGFDRFYGFMAGETDQYYPDLVHDSHAVDPPKTPAEGYHLTEDMVDRAIDYLKDLRAYSATQPFFMYFAPGAAHAPHQAPKEFIDPYRGKFDMGWDEWRNRVFQRQVDSGLLPPGTKLSERPAWVPEWATLSADEKRLYARMMEVFAGFLTHTDAQVGRLVNFLKTLDEFDNTIVLVMSDNGASAEGGPKGSYNEKYFFNFVPESLEENLKRIDLLGTEHANNHYPWGWAWAGNTPLKRFKRDTHEGGVCDPMIMHWGNKLPARGETRHQYVHVVDIVPTLLDILGMEPPKVIKGVTQNPIEGTSFAHTLPSDDVRSNHTTQYYEMLGSRAIYHDGWKAVVFHPPSMIAYDGSDATRPFDADIWELYNVAKDFSECDDLATTHPEKLKELQELWWSEADRYQVLPLNNQPGRYGDRRHLRDRYVYLPGISPLPESTAPNLKNRSFQIAAALNVPATGNIDGILVGHGSHSGGYALYIKGRRLHYASNFLGAFTTTISASIELPPGDVLVRAVFTATGRFKGSMQLYYGDVPVGEGDLPITTPVTYGVDPFTVGYQRMTPITEELTGKAQIPDGVLVNVVIDAIGPIYKNTEGEARTALSTQ